MQFNEKDHTYTKNNIKYISTTELLSKYQLSVDYGNIPKNVLQKAASKGKAVHKALETYIKTGNVSTVPEVKLFDNYIKVRGINLSVAKSEEIVYDTTYKIAGTIDFQYIDGPDVIIADFKNTSTLHLDSVAWQLSIYNYLLCKGDVLSYYFNKLKAFHFANGKLYVKDVYTVDYDTVKELFETNLRNDPVFVYVKTTKLISDADDILIKQILGERELYQQTLDKLNSELDIILDKVKTNMVQQKDYSIRTTDYILTYLAPQHRVSLNSKKVKQFITDQGYDVNDYTNETITKDGIRLTKL